MLKIIEVRRRRGRYDATAAAARVEEQIVAEEQPTWSSESEGKEQQVAEESEETEEFSSDSDVDAGEERSAADVVRLMRERRLQRQQEQAQAVVDSELDELEAYVDKQLALTD